MREHPTRSPSLQIVPASPAKALTPQTKRGEQYLDVTAKIGYLSMKSIFLNSFDELGSASPSNQT